MPVMRASSHPHPKAVSTTLVLLSRDEKVPPNCRIDSGSGF